MLHQIASLVLELVFGTLAGACVLRLYMQALRIPMSVRSGNPLGRFVFALTDWIVMPVRRIWRSQGRWDVASGLSALLLELVQFLLLWLLLGKSSNWASIPILAIFGLLRLILSGLTALVIVYAILSWVQTNSILADTVERLCAPALTPIRRYLPLVGGVDISPFVLLVILQVASIVLGHLQAAALL